MRTLITISTSEELFALIEKESRARKMTKAAFIRMCVMNQAGTKLVDPEAKEIFQLEQDREASLDYAKELAAKRRDERLRKRFEERMVRSSRDEREEGL